ncbi:hypothetical protein ACEZDB_13065 [Streptacidiphilus sp. N1-3]|uniref:Uncharacterized protein n=1 Tax=Streptacidiphilus alkalitolerans TaxID=3342712 RepID=A0ABV6WZX0_9ACTN
MAVAARAEGRDGLRDEHAEQHGDRQGPPPARGVQQAEAEWAEAVALVGETPGRYRNRQLPAEGG